MTKKNKKKSLIAILVSLALLVFLKNRKLTPSVEVGNGEFGDFGTDGDFTDTKTNPFFGAISTAKKYVNDTNVAVQKNTGIVPNLKYVPRSNFTKNTDGSNCQTC